MQIVIFNSSFRKGGNTAQILNLVDEELRRLAGQKKEEFHIETIDLGHQQIQTCRGCRLCFDKGEEFCPLKDDLLNIKARMKAADGIIVASPIYVDDVNGIMKNWIDRLAHVCHRPEFGGKSVYFIVTTGSSRLSHALRTLDIAFWTWGFCVLGKSGFKMGAKMQPERSAELFRAKAALIAQKIYQGLHSKRYLKPSFVSLMVFHTQQIGWSKASKDSIDYDYWQKQGWLDPHCEFYFPHQANWLKTRLARGMGAIIARFMT